MTLTTEAREVEIEILSASPECVRLSLPVVIGKDASCQLRLRAWRVARRHARLSAHADSLLIEDLGSWSGTWVNQRRVARYGALRPDDSVWLGGCQLRVRLLAAPAAAPAAATPVVVAPAEPAVSLTWVRRLHAVLLRELDLRRRQIEEMHDEALRSQAREVLQTWMARAASRAEEGLPQDDQRRAQLVTQVLDEALGYGPLQPLLADDSISEIMVNGHDTIYIEQAGRLQRQASAFSSEAALLAVMERMVAPLGRRLDDSMPLADARLPDGSRVHAVIRPIAVHGPCLTIRRFPSARPDLAALVAGGTLDAPMAAFLAQCVRLRCNVVVSGGTGSGKTTLLNALSYCIGTQERVITIEDAAELRLQHVHRVALEARPPNQEGQGEITIRELVRNALRMRPDRIIVGECRGPEALDMLMAMNTGHEGSLTTLHANSARDALARLETMVLMAGMTLPLMAIREQIAASVDVLLQLTRLPDGRRVVSEVTEVCGLEASCLQTQRLFWYDRRSACYRHGEVAPTFFQAWQDQGVSFSPAPFLTAEPDWARSNRHAAWSQRDA